MREVTTAAALLLVALSAAQPQDTSHRLTEAERQAGWRLLFDGRTTEGWLEITGNPFPTNCWTVEDGSLKALVRRDGFQDIRTVESFRSFDLEFDWKILKDGNSGVKYFVGKVDEWTNAAGRQARARGLEYQLADGANSDAASDPRRVAGALYSLIAPVPRIPPKIGAFNHSRLLVNGHHVEHWLNGVKVVQFETNELPAGSAPRVESSPISLQNHSSATWFRNIKIRVLTPESSR